MRIVLFTGKGGVGKTTTAAATAVRAAAAGHRVLVLSTDPAHSLSDALGQPLGPDPTPVVPGLHGLQVDAHRRFERSWEQVRGYLTALLRRSGLDEVTAEEIVVPPGVDEVFALLEVGRHVAAGQFDGLIVDCAPTAETLRLLALPEALSWYFERMYPTHRRLARSIRPLLGRDGASVLPSEPVLEAVEGLHRQLRAVQAVLTDPETTSVRLVLTPEAVVLAEARRLYTSLALYGFTVDAAIVNRVIPAGDDPWRAGWAAVQARHLEETRRSFADLEVHTIPYLPQEPVGVDNLGDLGATLYGQSDPLAVSPCRPPLHVGPDGESTDLLLTLQLPLAERGELSLARTADDLVVTVGSHRRLVALPEALRRRTVAGAALADGRLTIRFGTNGSDR